MEIFDIIAEEAHAEQQHAEAQALAWDSMYEADIYAENEAYYDALADAEPGDLEPLEFDPRIHFEDGRLVTNAPRRAVTDDSDIPF